MAEMSKILITTQKVDINDDVLGFFSGWIEEFAKNCEQVTVICLQKGEYDLPSNARVFSLGKERGVTKIRRIFNFYKYIWRERKDYDFVFVHMNPEYVLLGWLPWRLMGKKVSLWYTHKKVNCKLKIAEKLVNKIFTASEESFRLSSKKVVVTGHGIDVNKFKVQSPKLKVSKIFKVITVGRIAPTKNIHILIEVAKFLKSRNFVFSLKIAGAPILEEDKQYLLKLKTIVAQEGLSEFVDFVGAIPYRKIEEFYKEGDLFINLSDTGSIDKAVLEAMASGLKVLTSNEAFRKVLSERYITEKKPQIITEKIMVLSSLGEDKALREYVVQNHNLASLIKKIVNVLCAR